MAPWCAEVSYTHFHFIKQNIKRRARSSRGLIKLILCTALSETSWSEIGFFPPNCKCVTEEHSDSGMVCAVSLVHSRALAVSPTSAFVPSVQMLSQPQRPRTWLWRQFRPFGLAAGGSKLPWVGRSYPIWWAGRLKSHHQWEQVVFFPSTWSLLQGGSSKVNQESEFTIRRS